MKTRDETVCGMRLSDYGLKLPEVTTTFQFYSRSAKEQEIDCAVCSFKATQTSEC